MPKPKQKKVSAGLTSKKPAGEGSGAKPGGKSARTFRITNVRANAVAIGVSTTFTTAAVKAPKKPKP
jgi:hypothetical protein